MCWFLKVQAFIIVIGLFDFEITIQNIVLTGSFSEAIDLCVANSKLEGSKRNWKRFPGLAYKLKVPPATFLLFRNGKFVCTGIKSQAKGQAATAVFLERLKAEGLVSSNCVFECGVKNLVASVIIGGASISLEQFTNQFESVIYEHEKFPAAVYKMGESRATFLVFLTGKLICSGVADEETLKQAVKDFYDQLIEKNAIEKVLTSL